ncbi:hypothetical protein AAU61_07115 [Desulfocarbo indianensis]|nr:hypothetical protein AAU61_07115 [Desulfocarbo indianensis]
MSLISKSSLILTACLAAALWLAPAAVLAEDNLPLGRKLYEMGESRNPASVSFLLQNLASADPHVRRIAAHALGKIGDYKASEPLMKLAMDQSQPSMVRCCAIRSLGRIDAGQAKPCLSALCHSPDRIVRRAASSSLLLMASN